MYNFNIKMNTIPPHTHTKKKKISYFLSSGCTTGILVHFLSGLFLNQ